MRGNSDCSSNLIVAVSMERTSLISTAARAGLIGFMCQMQLWRSIIEYKGPWLQIHLTSSAIIWRNPTVLFRPVQPSAQGCQELNRCDFWECVQCYCFCCNFRGLVDQGKNKACQHPDYEHKIEDITWHETCIQCNINNSESFWRLEPVPLDLSFIILELREAVHSSTPRWKRQGLDAVVFFS